MSGLAAKSSEVALKATMGWQFVAEELRRVGGVVHLAELCRDSMAPSA